MKKEDLTVPAIFAEAIGMILGIVYIGLQIYYGIVYKVAPYKFICNIAGVVLIYVGLSLVSCQPEKINRLPKEVCVGKVRKYSIRMIRLVKTGVYHRSDGSVCGRCDRDRTQGRVQSAGDCRYPCDHRVL